MSLVLTLAAPWAIHQSSDYRLTPLTPSQAAGPDDVAGAKQLTVNSVGLVAQVCFTGAAQVGNLRTRERISQIIGQATQPVDIDRIASEIADRGTEAVKTFPLDRKMLTVVIAVAEHGKTPRIIMISNVDRFDGPRRAQPIDRLEVSSLVPTQPILRSFGWDVALSHDDRKYLIGLLRSNSNPKEIKEALAAVNRRIALDRKSADLISEGCMVSSLFDDGTCNAINFGEVAGVPDSFMEGINISDFIKKHFKAAPGKQITLVQSASAFRTGKEGYRELLPEGEPRTLHFSTATTRMIGIANTFGGEFDKLTLSGQAGSIAIRKNEPARAILNTVTWEMGETSRDESGFRQFPFLRITNLPTVDGAQPRSWDYLFDVAVGREAHSVTIHKMSTSLRSVHFEKALPILGPTEELVMVAPRENLTLTARIEERSITGTIEGEFLLRDFPELGPPTSHSISISLPIGSPTGKVIPVSAAKKVGRNAPCPCGSGKKFKKCHG